MSRFDGAIGDDEYPRALLEQNLRRMIAGKRGKKILRDLFGAKGASDYHGAEVGGQA